LKHKAKDVGFDGLTRINEIYAENEETAQIVEKR